MLSSGVRSAHSQQNGLDGLEKNGVVKKPESVSGDIPDCGKRRFSESTGFITVKVGLHIKVGEVGIQ